MLSIPEAHSVIEQGGVVVYPTEAVYGLGCSAFNPTSIKKLLAIKQRPIHKGLIILINDYEQLWPLTTLSPTDPLLDPVKAAWPGHVTFLFPKSKKVLDLVSGKHDTIAIRMSAHPVANQLATPMPICSTSANTTGHPPLQNPNQIESCFGDKLDGIVEGELGNEAKPSRIIDLCTQQTIR